MFYGCQGLLDSEETKLRSSDYEASQSEDKNSRVVLVLHFAWKLVPAAIFSALDISRFLGVIFYDR